MIEIIAQALPTAQIGVPQGMAVTIDGGSDDKHMSELTLHVTPTAPYKVGNVRRISEPALVADVQYFTINNLNSIIILSIDH